MKDKINITNIINYTVGNIRYKLYYSALKFIIRKHIREQIDFRIKFMKKECYENGECVLCGCATTALQMCNDSCEGTCYPPMMNKDEWRMFHQYAGTIRDEKSMINWRYYNGKLTATPIKPVYAPTL